MYEILCIFLRRQLNFVLTFDSEEAHLAEEHVLSLCQCINLNYFLSPCRVLNPCALWLKDGWATYGDPADSSALYWLLLLTQEEYYSLEIELWKEKTKWMFQIKDSSFKLFLVTWSIFVHQLPSLWIRW